MPRFLRNFWVNLYVTGYKEPVTRGPRSKAGGFNLMVNVASEGVSKELLTITGLALPSGKKRVIIEIHRDMTLGEYAYHELLGTDETGPRTLILEEN